MFNIRVYGLFLENNQVLVSQEKIKDEEFIKFPGGGLKYGEGIVDALKREWKEELNVDIKIEDHFYTTDFFQKSAWDDTQVISIYYIISLSKTINFPFHNGKEHIYFLNKRELLQKIKLPIDQIVLQKLITGNLIT